MRTYNKKNIYKKNGIILALFALTALAVILVSTLVLHIPVVGVCLLVVIETILAVVLHQVELWIHGILVIAEVIAGVALGKTLLIFLCLIVYVAATFVLQMMIKEK